MKEKQCFLKVDANVVVLCMYIGSYVVSITDGGCYFGWAIPLIVYLLEDKNKFVKGHAINGMLLFIISALFSVIVYFLSLIVGPVDLKSASNLFVLTSKFFLGTVVFLITLIFNIILLVFLIISVVKGYKYQDYKIPVMASYSDKLERLLNSLMKENKGNKRRRKYDKEK